VHAGRDLRDLPGMAEAALRGEVRLGHVRLLASAARAKAHRWSALPDVEALATASAATMSEPQFARFVERWAALVDAAHDAELRAQGVDVPVSDHPEAEQAERRELFLSRYGSDGMWALSGTLDTETGLSLSQALESICEAIRGGEEGRDLAELRHDALGVLLNGELSAGLPVHKGVRPHVLVVVRDDDDREAEPSQAPVTAGGGGGDEDCPAPGLLRDGIPIPGPGAQSTPDAGLAGPSRSEIVDRSDGEAGVLWLTGLARRRLTCDAIVQALGVDRDGVPLRLGRSARVVPPAIRRVIDLRDRHCTFAGCTAPTMWCQAHHMVHWEDGGPTEERNLVLICSYHHKLIHQRGFTLRWSSDSRRIETRRPDGSLIRVPLRRVT
jgi:hypothetical protein